MKANVEVIERIAREVSTSRYGELIIVHGGGSFGHPLAKKYGISEGYSSTGQLEGFSKTHQAMVCLNSIIVEAFLSYGVPSVSVAPSSFIVTDDGRISSSNFNLIQLFVKSGFVPVLYGDAVLDNNLRFTILSGDQLAVKLAIELGANKIIFGVDVDGVYTANPKLASSARLIPELSIAHMKGMIKIGEALHTDVTGGMLGKIQEAEAAVKAGIQVQLINGLKPRVIEMALRGEKIDCTWLRG